MQPSAPPGPKSSAKRTSGKSARTKSPRQPASERTLQVPLPGTLRQRDKRWWWNVKLPGEERAKARPLKPQGAEQATDDLAIAREVAVGMWEQALTETVEKRVRAETSQTVARLKAQFLEKVRDYTQVVETTKARLEAETQARAEAEARIQTSASSAVETTVCECCGAAEIPTASVKRIDSGQLLCRSCVAALQAEIERIESEMHPQ